MSRSRTLSVLFVRPAGRRSLASGLRFRIRREAAQELPLPLLRLASAVKFCTPHRVFVHDARAEVASADSSLRAVSAVHRPDASVVWLHPAHLADGLEAARAVRQSGCPLVLGAGPLVDLWPEGAAQIPELDGLLGIGAEAALLAALEGIAGSAGAFALSEALSLPSTLPAGGSYPIDRKLLDYARYRLATSSWPTAEVPWEPARLFGRGGPDRGRWAAARIPLHDLAGRGLRPGEVLDEMAACDLLGIRWQALAPGLTQPPIELDWWADILDVLREEVRHRRSERRLSLAMSPAVAASSALADLRSLGVVAVDLGDVTAGDAVAVAAAVQAAAACQRSDLQVSATLMLGAVGTSLEADKTGLQQVRTAGISVQAGVAVDIDRAHPGTWLDWLDAPTARFLPGGVDEARLDLAGRTNRVQDARGFRPSARRGLRARVRALLET